MSNLLTKIEEGVEVVAEFIVNEPRGINDEEEGQEMVEIVHPEEEYEDEPEDQEEEGKEEEGFGKILPFPESFEEPSMEELTVGKIQVVQLPTERNVETERVKTGLKLGMIVQMEEKGAPEKGTLDSKTAVPTTWAGLKRPQHERKIEPGRMAQLTGLGAPRTMERQKFPVSSGLEQKKFAGLGHATPLIDVALKDKELRDMSFGDIFAPLTHSQLVWLGFTGTTMLNCLILTAFPTIGVGIFFFQMIAAGCLLFNGKIRHALYDGLIELPRKLRLVIGNSFWYLSCYNRFSPLRRIRPFLKKVLPKSVIDKISLSAILLFFFAVPVFCFYLILRKILSIYIKKQKEQNKEASLLLTSAQRYGLDGLFWALSLIFTVVSFLSGSYIPATNILKFRGLYMFLMEGLDKFATDDGLMGWFTFKVKANSESWRPVFETFLLRPGHDLNDFKDLVRVYLNTTRPARVIAQEHARVDFNNLNERWVLFPETNDASIINGFRTMFDMGYHLGEQVVGHVEFDVDKHGWIEFCEQPGQMGAWFSSVRHGYGYTNTPWFGTPFHAAYEHISKVYANIITVGIVLLVAFLAAKALLMLINLRFKREELDVEEKIKVSGEKKIRPKRKHEDFEDESPQKIFGHTVEQVSDKEALKPVIIAVVPPKDQMSETSQIPLVVTVTGAPIQPKKENILLIPNGEVKPPVPIVPQIKVVTPEEKKKLEENKENSKEEIKDDFVKGCLVPSDYKKKESVSDTSIDETKYLELVTLMKAQQEQISTLMKALNHEKEGYEDDYIDIGHWADLSEEIEAWGDTVGNISGYGDTENPMDESGANRTLNVERDPADLYHGKGRRKKRSKETFPLTDQKVEKKVVKKVEKFSLPIIDNFTFRAPDADTKKQQPEKETTKVEKVLLKAGDKVIYKGKIATLEKILPHRKGYPLMGVVSHVVEGKTEPTRFETAIKFLRNANKHSIVPGQHIIPDSYSEYQYAIVLGPQDKEGIAMCWAPFSGAICTSHHVLERICDAHKLTVETATKTKKELSFYVFSFAKRTMFPVTCVILGYQDTLPPGGSMEIDWALMKIIKGSYLKMAKWTTEKIPAAHNGAIYAVINKMTVWEKPITALSNGEHNASTTHGSSGAVIWDGEKMAAIGMHNSGGHGVNHYTPLYVFGKQMENLWNENNKTAPKN
jgi:hypothetical protein